MIDERECGWIFSAQRGNTTVPKVALDANWFEQRIQLKILKWKFLILLC